MPQRIQHVAGLNEVFDFAMTCLILSERVGVKTTYETQSDSEQAPASYRSSGVSRTASGGFR
jgi:hypothetical protein